MKFIPLPFFISIILLTSCQLKSQEIDKSIRLKDKGNAQISLEVQSKGYFVNTVSGTAHGPEMFQRMGNLDLVVKSFIGDRDVQIRGLSSRKVYKITVRDYPSDKVMELQTDILDFMAKEVGFKWTIENGNAKYHIIRVEDTDLLKKAANTEENGATKMINLSNKKLKYFGSLEELEEVIEQNIPEYEFLFDLSKIDFKVNLDLSLKNITELTKSLKKYGISLTKEVGEKETIVIKAN